MGGTNWWWHGEGAWSWRHDAVRQTMASDQKRTAAFGAVTEGWLRLTFADEPEIFDQAVSRIGRFLERRQPEVG